MLNLKKLLLLFLFSGVFSMCTFGMENCKELYQSLLEKTKDSISQLKERRDNAAISTFERDEIGDEINKEERRVGRYEKILENYDASESD